MNREELKSLINKRILASGGVIPEEEDESQIYNQYEPQNMVADWFDKPEWRISKREAYDASDRLMEEAGLGMGSIGKVTSMLTPEVKALREMIAKRNAIEKAGEEGGKLIKVEGGGLEDIRNAQEELSGLLRAKETSNKKLLQPSGLNRFGFEDYLRTMTDKPVDRWNGEDLKNVFPDDYSNYLEFMKKGAKEGMLESGSWATKYRAPEAGKIAESVSRKQRRDLDKVYQTAKDALESGDLEAYDIYKSVVEQLVNNTNPRNRYKYFLPEPPKQNIIPFRGRK